MADQQFKRNIAYKLRIGEILIGKPIFDAERFIFLELGERKIIRINLIANIVEKYESEGEKKFIVFTLDDGSGQIKMRAFAEDVEKFKSFNQGNTILVIGMLRSFNNELYILPEIIREQDPKYLLLRKLETEKIKNKSAPQITGDKITAIKDKILEKIKNAEEQGGIDTEKLIMEITEATPEMINQEIKKLLEDGIIFEPRPGKVRYLG
jgi:RPA family protein